MYLTGQKGANPGALRTVFLTPPSMPTPPS
jgi:hypothetical protein